VRKNDRRVAARDASTKRVFREPKANRSALFPVSGSGSFGPPAWADPEQRVIGQASPSQFDPRLDQPRRENFRSPIFSLIQALGNSATSSTRSTIALPFSGRFGQHCGRC